MLIDDETMEGQFLLWPEKLLLFAEKK